MAAKFWIGGTGNYSDATHWSTTSGGSNDTTKGVAGDTVTFDASSGGGTVTFDEAVSVTSITCGAFTGTLDTNGKAVTTSGAFTISGTGARTVTLGASTVTCGSWEATTTTNLTFNSNTSTIVCGASNFNGGGKTYNIVSITSVGLETFSGSNTFATLTLTGSASITAGFSIGANQTVTGTLTINGNSTTNRVLIRSDTLGTARTLTAAVVSVTNADFMDITGAGAGSWDLSAVTGGSGDCLGNSGITFTTAATQTWSGTSGGNWSANAWTTRIPLPQDDVVISSAFSGSQTITVNMPRAGKNIDFTGTTGNPTVNFSTLVNPRVFGSMTIVSAMTTIGRFDMYARSSVNLTTNNNTSMGDQVSILAFGGTVTLVGDLNGGSSGYLELRNGTFNANGYNVTVRGMSCNSGSTRTLTMGSGTWTFTANNNTATVFNFSSAGLTLNANTSTIKFVNTLSSTVTITGGSLAYNNIWFSRASSTGSLVLAGSNTFNEFKDDGTAAHSLLFTTGTTQTVVTFNVNGSAGNEITINSTTTGAHKLDKTGGGTINCNYLNIQHSVATPANTWFANNSTNNQGVATAGSGWIFNVLGATTGAFTLTGNAANLVAAVRLTTDAARFILTGSTITLISAITTLTATAGNFILTGLSAVLTRVGWNNSNKNSSTWVNQDKS